jgi:hypothetical protein
MKLPSSRYLVGIGLGIGIGLALQPKSFVTSLSKERDVNRASEQTRSLSSIEFNPRHSDFLSVGDIEPENRRDVLAGFFTGELAEPLTEATALIPFQASPTPEGRRLSDILKKLLRQPKESFQAIREGLPRLPSEFDKEREFLLRFATGLNVDRSKKLALVREEISRPLAKSNGIDPLVTLDCLLSVTHDEQEIERDSLRLLKKTSGNALAKLQMLARLDEQYPELRKKLSKRLSQDSIDNLSR